ncbi:hypothetical protein DL96DRAFT_599049 [Flagelloscypha sp. PMI_526]|nr:hypothetical protein DL96DRAFT_599049 [Flagelloscypha sp. PMI_526]
MSGKGEGIRAVSFDDGPPGPVGLCQIYAFKEVLSRLAYDLNQDEDTLQPSDYFDLFAGTGLGGVYVILLTRLRMKISEVFEFHDVLQEKLFSSESWLNKDPDACALQLNTVLDQALSTYPLEENLDAPDSPKGMICILNPVYPNIPRFLRTYRVRQGFGPRCTIRQAFHAALADGLHLPPVLIKHDRVSAKFIAAGHEVPDPTTLLMKELRLCFPKAEHVSCILSIGTGPDRDNTAQTVATQCRDLGSFFVRLSVKQLPPDVGDDASQAMLVAVENYLLVDETSDLVDSVVLAVKERPHIISPIRLTSLAGEDGKSQVQAKIEHLTATVSLSRLTDILRPSTPISSFGQQHTPCLPNTRRDVIAQLHDVLTDTTGSNICVVRGHPGTGKSSVATSLAQEFASTGILGAQFFCRRDESSTHSARNLWRLIALGLAQTQPAFAQALSSTFAEAVPDVAALSVPNLFDSIITKPLAALTSVTTPIVVIIDALDEFGGLDSPNPTRKELITSLKFWERLPAQFKLFVTTREQADVISLLHLDSATILTLEVTHDLASQTSLDIRHYFEHHFEQIASRYQSLPTPWPCIADLDLLTTRAAGLFIWASTIVKLVELRPSTLYTDLLPRIRAGSLVISGDTDALYRTLLAASFPPHQLHPLFTTVVGSIITAYTPLTRPALCRLLVLDEIAVEEVCQALQPVLDSKIVLTFHHQSFVDFILSTDCPDTFRCALGQHHTTLLNACLAVINSPQVHFNMARMESSYLMHNEIPGLKERVSEHVRYTSRGLTWHSKASLSHLEGIDLEDIVGQLRHFLERKLLFWLELVCLEDAFLLVSKELRLLVGDFENKLNCILPCLQDSLSFMNTLVGPIRHSYPHIYLSSLSFAPRTSLIAQNFQNNLQGCIIATGVHDTWSHGIVINFGDDVEAIAFSPNSHQIVTGSRSNEVQVWDAESGAAVGEPLLGYDGMCTAVAFSPDGFQIVSGSGDGTVIIWDVESGAAVKELWTEDQSEVIFVAFSSDGHQIVTGSEFGAVEIWDVESGTAVEELHLEHEQKVTSIAFSPDGLQILSGSWDMTVRVLDAKSGKPIGKPLLGHKGFVSSVAFSPDGLQIISGSHDGTVRIWDAVSRKPVGEPLIGHKTGVLSVAFSPDGHQIISGSFDKTVRVWDAVSRKPVGEPLVGHKSWVSFVAFSPNGRQIVSGSEDRTVRVWDAVSRKGFEESFHEHETWVTSVAFSPNGLQIVSGSLDKTVRVWDAESGKPVGGPLLGHTSEVSSVAFSPDGSQIISSSHDGTVRIWDAVSKKPVGEPLLGHELAVKSVAFSPDGRQIVSGSKDKTVRVWDAESGKLVREPLVGHEDEINSVAFSLDGRQIVSGSGDRTVRVWDALSGTLVGGPLLGHEMGVSSVAFSPDSLQIVSGSYDDSLRVWDVESGKPVGKPLLGHEYSVVSATFSSDGRQIVSGSFDNTVRVWDAISGAAIGRPLAGHQSAVRSVAISPNGCQIISGSNDTTVRIWDTSLSAQFAASPHHTIFFSSPSSYISLRDDGWVVNQDNEQLWFIPFPDHFWVQKNGCVAICGTRPMITFDLTNFRHGNEWAECFKM